jgi:hypothetical protein
MIVWLVILSVISLLALAWAVGLGFRLAQAEEKIDALLDALEFRR